MDTPKKTKTTQTPWFLTVPEVATISRETDEGVRFAIKKGKLVATRRAGKRQYLVTKQAVAEWLGVTVEEVDAAWTGTCVLDETPDDDQDAA